MGTSGIKAFAQSLIERQANVEQALPLPFVSVHEVDDLLNALLELRGGLVPVGRVMLAEARAIKQQPVGQGLSHDNK